ncbi:MAG: UDP-glucose dehydrogenase family protein [Candidatus Woesearchaeota archaeon]
MKISIIGTGYVGLVTGTGLADLGHEVICIDIDKKKIENLKKGIIPIYEVGLKELVDRNIKEGRLDFSTSISKIKETEAVFIAVGTPQDEDGSADLKYVIQVSKDIGKNLNDYKVIVTKSTVPVGTSEIVRKTVEKNTKIDFDVASNPEFLREGSAVKDFFTPDRIVIGTDTEKAKEVMKKIYRGIERTGKPILFTDIKSSEIIKYASNAMLATRISFANMLSQLCEKQGADITMVSKGMGLDTRIGPRFLHAGIGYGGSCFPKDVKAMIKTLDDNKCDSSILKSVDQLNNNQRKLFVNKILKTINVKGKTIAIWGLAFKPKTDDMRQAPSIDIINELKKKGAKIKAFDPVAEENAKKMLKDIQYCKKPLDTLKDADALIVLTEWDEFRSIEFKDIKSRLKSPIIFDGRNIYDSISAKEEGISYFSIGR